MPVAPPGYEPAMKERLDALGRRYGWVGNALRVQERYGELNGNYLAAAVTLAGFVSLFPLLLVGIAVLGFFSSGAVGLAEDAIARMGLTGDAARLVRDTMRVAEHSRRVASVLGIAGLLWSGLGLVAAMQYAVNTVWQVTGRGWKDRLAGLAWLGGAALVFLASFGLTGALRVMPDVLAPLSLVVTLALDVALWLWTLQVLTRREVGWRPLLPGALFGAAGFELLKVLGAIFVPWAVSSASALYGSLGVVFAILAWLLFFGRLFVYAAVLNVVRWEQAHGTVTVDLDVPRVPGEVAMEATRAGDVKPDA